MKCGPKISIIVPVYKAEKYIHRCVDSILAQTFSDFELILVDDGSPDSCGAICDDYAAKDSRIRVIHQKNQGQAIARNRAVAEARGDWVCFVDSDDLIHPQMLEHLYRAAMEHNANISMCGAVEAEQMPEDFLEPRSYVSSSLWMDENGMEVLYRHGEHRYWVVWGKLIRKEILEKLPFAPGRVYEDNAVVCQWLHEAVVVADIPNRYYFYQINPSGTTKTGFALKHLDFLWALNEQIVFYNAHGYERMKREICAYYLKTAAWYASRVRNELNNYKKAAEIRHDMRQLIRDNPLDALPLSQEECKAIRRAFHPAWEQMKRLPNVVAGTFRSGGVAELTRRVLRKFKRS